jgi:hypothetical protein
MQTAHHFRLYDRTIRAKIGEALRTLLVPTEPAPKMLLDLLDALNQPRGGDISGNGIISEPPPLADLGTDRVEEITGGWVVRDANDQALVYLYCRVNESEALQANVLTEGEAYQIAVNVAKLRSRQPRRPVEKLPR